MKIEYNFYKAGLVRLDELVPGTLFINGGLMNQPDLFLVLYPPPIKAATDKGMLNVFNLTKSHFQQFKPSASVAVVSATLSINGYHENDRSVKDAPTDDRLHTDDRTHTVEWIIEVDAGNEVEAAQKAAKIFRDPESTARFFRVTRPCGTIKKQVELTIPEMMGEEHDKG